jgi:hypothetical protein
MIGGGKKKGEEKSDDGALEDGVLPRSLKYIFQLAKEQVQRNLSLDSMVSPSPYC